MWVYPLLKVSDRGLQSALGCFSIPLVLEKPVRSLWKRLFQNYWGIRYWVILQPLVDLFLILTHQFSVGCYYFFVLCVVSARSGIHGLQAEKR